MEPCAMTVLEVNPTPFQITFILLVCHTHFLDGHVAHAFLDSTWSVFISKAIAICLRASSDRHCRLSLEVIAIASESHLRDPMSQIDQKGLHACQSHFGFRQHLAKLVRFAQEITEAFAQLVK